MRQPALVRRPRRQHHLWRPLPGDAQVRGGALRMQEGWDNFYIKFCGKSTHIWLSFSFLHEFCAVKSENYVFCEEDSISENDVSL